MDILWSNVLEICREYSRIIFSENVLELSGRWKDVAENREEETERQRQRQRQKGKVRKEGERKGARGVFLSPSPPLSRPSFRPSLRPSVPFFVVNLLFRFLFRRSSSLAAARGVGKHHTGSPVDFHEHLTVFALISLFLSRPGRRWFVNFRIVRAPTEGETEDPLET